MAPQSVKGVLPEDGFLVDNAAVGAFAQVVLENGGVFEGHVEIGENVTSLEGLESLEQVEGILMVASNPHLASLDGLGGLASVGSSVVIRNNTSLASLAGLEALTSVGGGVHIDSNANLTSISGLSSLSYVWDTLEIENNNPQLLADDASLETIIKVGGYVNPGTFDQSLLQAVASLPNLADEVEVVLTLDTDSAVSAVGDFVASRDGMFPESLRIAGKNVTSLGGLSGLKHVGGDFHITFDTNFASLAGLEGLVEVEGDLSISANDKLVSLAGLESLTRVGGALYVDDPSDPGLGNLVSIGEGGLDVYNRNVLAPLAGLYGEPILQSIQSLPDLLTEGEVDVILTLDSEVAVSAVGDFAASIGGAFPGSLEVRNVASLASLSRLTSVGGDLRILGNGKLTSLAGLEGLTSIGGNLDIWYNHELKSLAGLEGLTTVGGHLHIYDNAQVTSLGALASVSEVTGSIEIRLTGSFPPIQSFEELQAHTHSSSNP